MNKRITLDSPSNTQTKQNEDDQNKEEEKTTKKKCINPLNFKMPINYRLTKVRSTGTTNCEEFILPDYYEIKKFIGINIPRKWRIWNCCHGYRQTK